MTKGYAKRLELLRPYIEQLLHDLRGLSDVRSRGSLLDYISEDILTYYTQQRSKIKPEKNEE